MSPSRLPLLRTGATALAAAVPGLLTAPRGVRRALGAGRRRFDYSTSPQFRDGLFHNRLPASVVEPGTGGSMARELVTKGRVGKPRRPVQVAAPALPAAAGDLAATWLGHATVLLEVAGRWVLTDPVWSDRVSPSQGVGPRRLHPAPMAVRDLPRLSAVLISHDHYDHLDTATIDLLVATQTMPFVVPLGVGRHLSRWGVPEDRIVELDWDEATRVDGLTLTCTEARHFSGRSLGTDTTLWSSWVVAGEQRRVYFGGDSGYFPAYAALGERHGPFDLTVLPIGAYDRRWPDVHLDPVQAVQAHLELRGEVMLPIHWATYDLAFHPWAAPAEWLLEASAAHGVQVALPAPGARWEPGTTRSDAPWWRPFA